MSLLYKLTILLIFILFSNTTFAGFESITWDKNKTKFYVSNTNGSVSEMDENANTTFLTSGFGIAKGVLLPFENLLAVAAGNQVVVYSLAVNMVVKRIPVSGSSDLTDIAYSSGRYMYVTDYKQGAVFEVEIVEPFSSKKICSGLDSPKGIRYTGAGLVVVEHTENSALKVINTTSGDITRTILPGLDYAYGIAYDKFGNYYVSAWGSSGSDAGVFKLINGIDGDPMKIYSDGSKPANIYYHSIMHKIYVPDLDKNYINMIDLAKLPPDPPELYNPYDEETDVDIEVEFFWKNISNTDEYSIEISENSDFTSVINSSISESNSYNFDDFEYNTTYYWRVRSINANGESPWSDTFSFTTGEKAIDIPALKFPEDLAGDIELKPVLEWNEINENADYHIQLSTTDFFDENLIINDTVTITTFELTEDLEENKTYYWRVRAIVGELKSEWSFVRSFTTLEVLVPGKPVITFPENNSEDISVELTLAWDESENVFEYEILLLNNNRDEIHTAKLQHNQLSYELPFKLEHSEIYYLIITAYNEDLTISTSSDEIKFTTEALSSITFSRENDNIVISPNPASDRISIDITDINLGQGNNLTVSIFNSIGAEVLSIDEIWLNNIDVSLATLSSGTYYLVVRNKQSAIVKNIIIHK